MFRQWNTGTNLDDYRDQRREKFKQQLSNRVKIDVPSCLMILTAATPWLYYAAMEVLKSLSIP